jgi:hypothetical protein
VATKKKATAKKKVPAKKTSASKPKQKVIPPRGPTPVPDRKTRNNATFYQGSPYDDKKSKMYMNAPNKNRINNVPYGVKFEGYY